MGSLKTKTLKGLFWSLSDTFGAYFIKFGFSVAIARALNPSDYGLMGMIIIFVAIGNLLTESGFGMALIQKKDTTDADFSTIFYFNFIVSLLIYAILFFSAHMIANFYKQPILVNVIRVSALTIVFGSLGTIQTIILSKSLDFKRQTFISLGATIISGSTGVIIAYNGYSVWALVFQTMTGTILRLLGLWITSKWYPSLIFSWNSLKELYKYGYKIFLTGLSDILFTKMYFPLIGKYFSAAQLGYYTNATSFSGILVKQTSISYGRVLFPVMSLIQSNQERLSRSYCTIFRLLSFVMFPVSVIAIVSSHAFVDFFLTTKWLPAVPYMQLFLLEGFFFALYMLNQNTFSAIGLSGLTLKVEIFKKSLVFLSLFITFKYGIKALIIGQMISSFIAFLYTLFHIQKKVDLKMRSLLIELLKLGIVSIVIVLIDYFLFAVYIQRSGILLLCNLLLLPFLYLLFVYLMKVHALSDICSVFNKIIPPGIITFINDRFIS